MIKQLETCIFEHIAYKLHVIIYMYNNTLEKKTQFYNKIIKIRIKVYFYVCVVLH